MRIERRLPRSRLPACKKSGEGPALAICSSDSAEKPPSSPPPGRRGQLSDVRRDQRRNHAPTVPEHTARTLRRTFSAQASTRRRRPGCPRRLPLRVLEARGARDLRGRDGQRIAPDLQLGQRRDRLHPLELVDVLIVEDADVAGHSAGGGAEPRGATRVVRRTRSSRRRVQRRPGLGAAGRRSCVGARR